ncbi:MAG: hypothetical protein ABID54_05825 [Pseudomonadota bacterium]
MNSVGELIGDYFKISLSHDRESEFVSRLDVGEVLEGRVVKSLGNQKAVVSFKGTRVVAETRSPLSPGDNIVVRVEQLKPRVILNLLPEKTQTSNKATSLLKMYLPNRVPLGEVIEKLQRILGEKSLVLHTNFDKALYQSLKAVLSNIIFDEGKVFKPEYILNFITQSGLLYESKLKRLLAKSPLLNSDMDKINNDLKGLLLKISGDSNLNESLARLTASQDEIPKEKIEYFLKTVRELVENIELTQLTNSIAKKEGDYLYLQIPLAFRNGFDNGELHLYYNRKGAPTDAEREDFSLVFLLHMEGLGNIRIDTNIEKRVIYCRIIVESHEVASFVNGFLPQLKDRLTSLDYTVEEIDCTVLEDSPEAWVGFGESFIPDSTNFVDIKV